MTYRRTDKNLIQLHSQNNENFEKTQSLALTPVQKAEMGAKAALNGDPLLPIETPFFSKEQPTISLHLRVVKFCANYGTLRNTFGQFEIFAKNVL